MKFTHTSTSGLFEGCDTIEAVKRRYHELARTMHPDCGGDAEAFKALSAEYTARFDVFRDIHEARDGHVYKAEEESTERPEQYKEAIDAAREAGALLSAEGAWHHCIYSPEQMARFLREIDTGAVRVTVDVLNYLYIGNYEQRRSIFDKCLELFSEKIAIFHIKDFVVQDGKLVEVGIGKGIMGWDTFLPEIKKNVPNAILVFEGVKDLDESLAYFRSLMETL